MHPPFPNWNCKDAINFVLDYKQASVRALCLLQCDTKIKKVSESALKKMAQMLTEIEIDKHTISIII